MLSQKREDINNIKYILTQAYHPECQKWHRKPKTERECAKVKYIEFGVYIYKLDKSYKFPNFFQ